MKIKNHNSTSDQSTQDQKKAHEEEFDLDFIETPNQTNHLTSGQTTGATFGCTKSQCGCSGWVCTAYCK